MCCDSREGSRRLLALLVPLPPLLPLPPLVSGSPTLEKSESCSLPPVVHLKLPQP
jgi:hypothetical protein